MKLEDAQIDQIVWQCHTSSSSDDVTLRKGIVIVDVQGTGLTVRPLGVYIKGKLRHLSSSAGNRDVENWHESPEVAVNKIRQFYDMQAAKGHNKLNKLLASLADKPHIRITADTLRGHYDQLETQ